MMLNVSVAGADFTPPDVERLLAETERGLERGETPLRLYGDPEIWDVELTRIFLRCWIFVAHESEIPAPHDYVQRSIADTPLIVTRGESGAVHVLFDSCRHRGAKLCRGDKGNAPQFRCPYHGWTYRSDGTLIGVPSRAEAYGDMALADWNLLSVRSESYRGLIFAVLDPNAPPLADYLGDFRWYLDIHFDLGNVGLEVVGSPLRSTVSANWKTASENFAGDSYHTNWMHRSMGMVGMRPTTMPGSPYNVHVTECGGHATSISRAEPGATTFWGNGAAYEGHYRNSGLSPEQLDIARRSVTGQGAVFPNFGWVHSIGNDDTVSENAGFFSLSLTQPRSATSLELWRWVLVPKTFDRAQRERSYSLSVASFGPAGNFEQDDTTVWSGIAAAGKSAFARIANPKLNYTMGMHGTNAARIVPDWPGPGTVYDSRLEDGVMKTMLRTWVRHMRTP